MIRSGNPAISAGVWRDAGRTEARAMTIQGAVNKTLIMLFVLLATAMWSWVRVAPENAMGFLIGGALGGLVLALVTIFKKTWAPVTAPLYAALEGVFLGVISKMFEAQYAGIVTQAVFLTMGVCFVMLMAYSLEILRATPAFVKGVAAATGGIFFLYLLSFILGFFGVSIPLIHGSGMFGIGFSIFVVVIAALNLILDFELIVQGAKQNAPKYMEWYGAFALMVTLIWLYIEILHLLAKLQRR